MDGLVREHALDVRFGERVVAVRRDGGGFEVETTRGRHCALAVLIGLARQPDNVVTLSYRRDKLVRIRKKNEERIAPLLRSGAVRPMFGSRVTEIRPDAVTLAVGAETMELPNDYVFVFAGGEPPYAFLRSAGVSFGEGGAAPAPSSSSGTSRGPDPART